MAKPSFYLVLQKLLSDPPILRHTVCELELGGAEGCPGETAHVQILEAGRGRSTKNGYVDRLEICLKIHGRWCCVHSATSDDTRQ